MRGAGCVSLGRRYLPARRPVVQFPIYLGADRGFNDAVVHAAEHPRLGSQLDAIRRVDIAVHRAVHQYAGGEPRALDAAALADRQDRVALQLTLHIAVDVTVEMQSARKFDVAVNARLGADPRVDLDVFTRFPFEHRIFPWMPRRSPRFRPTCLELSIRTPAGTHASSLCGKKL